MSHAGGFAVRSRARGGVAWGAGWSLVIALGVLSVLPARLSAQGVAAESEQVTYYAHIVERAGLPVGIHELTPAQQGRTEASYKFVRRGGVLLRLDYVNGSGTLLDDDSGIARYVFEYGAPAKGGGRVARWLGRSKSSLDTVKRVLRFSEDLSRVDYQDGAGHSKPLASTHITTIRRKLDKRGFIQSETFLDGELHPQPDKGGDFGWQFVRNAQGQVLRRQALDEKGRPLVVPPRPPARGARTVQAKPVEAAPFTPRVAQEEWRYDEHGEATEHRFYDEAGHSLRGPDGVATFLYRWDEVGSNLAEVRYQDPAGQPTLHREGMASRRYRYDEHGNESEWAYFDSDGKPTLNKNGIAGGRALFDEHGYKTQETYFDTEGKPTRNKNGIAIMRIKYDERGFESEISYFDADDKPTAHRDGNASLRFKHDEHGNRNEWSYFGINGKPIIIKYKYATLRAKYDDRNNQTELSYYDIDGKLTLRDGRYAILRAKYDEQGNMIEHSLLDTEEKPTWHSDGYSICREKFDALGHPIERAYFDTQGQPTLVKEHYSSVRHKYDARGNRLEEAFLDDHGQPVQRRGKQFRFAKVEPRPFDVVFLDPPRWSKGPFGAVDVVREVGQGPAGARVVRRERSGRHGLGTVLNRSAL